MKVLVSACLLGENCKYNGGNNYDPAVAALLEGWEVIPVCPERCLGIPRSPMELRQGRLVDREGEDRDEAVRAEVEKILGSLEGESICGCILKSRSPTCGAAQVYDGSFTGTLVRGRGILAEALVDGGYRVWDGENLPRKIENNL